MQEQERTREDPKEKTAGFTEIENSKFEIRIHKHTHKKSVIDIKKQHTMPLKQLKSSTDAATQTKLNLP